MQPCCLKPRTVYVVHCFRLPELHNLEKCSIRKLWRIRSAFQRYKLQLHWINRIRVTAILLHCGFLSHEEFQISCPCPYTRVSLGCQNILILVSSSKRMCKLFLCPLVYLFLRGVAKLKNLQDEVAYVLVCAAEAWWAHNP